MGSLILQQNNVIIKYNNLITQYMSPLPWKMIYGCFCNGSCIGGAYRNTKGKPRVIKRAILDVGGTDCIYRFNLRLYIYISA
jgi:hypothetical protein